ncbi:STAS domain-containing protein [Nonomuraea sp. 3N208]|uniref:STAS domain-containing protein n=1 Tax=Nonomuraea sp. 3N208 TaxID=3457421 RepID=UPI003FD5518C
MPDQQPDLEIERVDHDGCCTLHLSGHLGRDAQRALRDETIALLNETRTPCLVLDIGRVTSHDEAGLGAIISALKRLMLADGRLVIAATPPGVMLDLQRRGLDRVFKLYENVDLALAAMRSGRDTH